jgi:serine/threonine protein kinase
LRKEVRTAREIAHPNVCRTYDIATVDGLVFLVMEYIGGEDLASCSGVSAARRGTRRSRSRASSAWVLVRLTKRESFTAI